MAPTKKSTTNISPSRYIKLAGQIVVEAIEHVMVTFGWLRPNVVDLIALRECSDKPDNCFSRLAGLFFMG